jgi:hypothetical protein
MVWVFISDFSHKSLSSAGHVDCEDHCPVVVEDHAVVANAEPVAFPARKLLHVPSPLGRVEGKRLRNGETILTRHRIKLLGRLMGEDDRSHRQQYRSLSLGVKRYYRALAAIVPLPVSLAP